jgi:hypothetical protein
MDGQQQLLARELRVKQWQNTVPVCLQQVNPHPTGKASCAQVHSNGPANAGGRVAANCAWRR